ncbi:MAG: glycosyl hydrolase, partial [Niabella sp.]
MNRPVAKPLYDDPVYHGAADPVIIYNKHAKKWWMFYTNRRATLPGENVTWVHGTKIGIAESDNGREWKYVDTANINYRPDVGYTFWAPDIILDGEIFHMYLTYVPGTFSNWSQPREIIHLISKDLKNWHFQSVLPVGNHKVIDAEVVKIKDGHWRMWYNNESDKKSIYYADSEDLYHWKDKGKAFQSRGEGPEVFYW